MALLNKLKSILGIGGGPDNEGRTDGSVTVERDATDRAGSETDDSEGGADGPSEDEHGETGTDETVAAGTDASASTGSMTDSDGSETEAATEPAEAAGPPTDAVDDEPADPDVEEMIDEAEAADETADNDTVAEDAADDEDEPNVDNEATEDDPEPSTGGADLTAIKGIGPAYSERLNAAGIDSVAALADADAETVSEQIDVSPKIVSDWIDRAADQ